MLGAFDSLWQVFAALAAALGGALVWVFKLWQGQKDATARAEVEAANEKGKRLAEKASRAAAEKAKQDADKATRDAEKRVSDGELDHFENQ